MGGCAVSIHDDVEALETFPLDEAEVDYISHEIRLIMRESLFHDDNGYICDFAGDSSCLALGHEPDPEEGWSDDDAHPKGWSGVPVCPATKWQAACSYCESDDCQSPPLDRDAFWALFRSAA
jgi:hypothetical protein